MRDFLADTRRCATCHWWEAERLAGTLRGRVYTPRHALMGFCRSPESWWNGRPKQAESLCCFWQQWEQVSGLGARRTRLSLVMLGPAMPPSEFLKALTASAASHVLLIEPLHFRYNPETGETNAFQVPPSPGEEAELGALALRQHHALRDLLVENGVAVTLTRSVEATPDGPFCNNWFSTQPASDEAPATLILYPLLAENRRTERRTDLVALLRPAYPRLLDFSSNERKARFLESTGSLVLDQDARTAYAALSPRTDFSLATEWARELEYDLVAFTAVDRAGIPYYHTNVLMFIGHGLAGVCLEAIRSPAERSAVEAHLQRDGRQLLPLSQEQTASFCGNCLALCSSAGEPLFVMSSRAWGAFSAEERARLERHGRILHTDLSAFERLGGGSARCLMAELF
ncbi:MAG TPA: arginine deiminase-related protein [Gemmatimonadales bacterium]|jgi:hypothetical protein|nr:arginine deiminase-related protein [Gemmatimonadales bacterium]